MFGSLQKMYYFCSTKGRKVASRKKYNLMEESPKRPLAGLGGIENPANYATHEKPCGVEAVELLQEIFADGGGSLNYEADETAASLDGLEVDIDAPYTPPEVVLMMNGEPILSRGQFSDIIGQAGSRKSWFCQALASVFLSNRPRGLFHSPLEGAKVVYIDTEMGANMAARVGATIKRLTGQESPRLHVYSLRELPTRKRFAKVAAIIAEQRPDIVIIDGIADLCVSPNNEAEATAVQQFCMTFSAKYNCHIVNVIHDTKGNAKDQQNADTRGVGGGRGHLGSNLTRKAEMEFYTHKEGDATSITMPKDSRLSRPQPPFGMVINADGLPEFTDIKPQTSRAICDNDEIVAILQRAEADGVASMRRKDIAAKLAASSGRAAHHCGTLVDKAAQAGVIVKLSNGLYRTNNQ